MSTLTQYRCDVCNVYLAEEQLRRIPAGQGAIRACPTCGHPVRAEVSRAARPLVVELGTAFVYPFRPKTLAAMVAVLVASVLVGLFPFVGGLLAASFQIAFFFAVLRSTANGQDEVSLGIDGDWLGWLTPLLRYLGVAIVAFAPAVAALVLVGGAPMLAGGLALAGLAYLPAAVVVAAHNESFGAAVNPAPAIGLIGRIPGPYFLTLAFLVLAVGAGALVMAGAAAVEIPLVQGVLVALARTYAPVAMARMLGVLVREHQEEL